MSNLKDLVMNLAGILSLVVALAGIGSISFKCLKTKPTWGVLGIFLIICTAAYLCKSPEKTQEIGLVIFSFIFKFFQLFKLD